MEVELEAERDGQPAESEGETVQRSPPGPGGGVDQINSSTGPSQDVNSYLREGYKDQSRNKFKSSLTGNEPELLKTTRSGRIIHWTSRFKDSAV